MNLKQCTLLSRTLLVSSEGVTLFWSCHACHLNSQALQILKRDRCTKSHHLIVNQNQSLYSSDFFLWLGLVVVLVWASSQYQAVMLPCYSSSFGAMHQEKNLRFLIHCCLENLSLYRTLLKYTQYSCIMLFNCMYISIDYLSKTNLGHF